jgi:hypothetical protein
MRHEFWQSTYWGKTVDYVIQHLAEANFDPELFTNYNKEIKQQFTTEFIGQK